MTTNAIALQYRQRMAQLLRIQDGNVVLPEGPNLTQIEEMWNAMSPAEQDEADNYISELATGQLSLEVFIRDTAFAVWSQPQSIDLHSSSRKCVILVDEAHASFNDIDIITSMHFEVRDLEATINIVDNHVIPPSLSYRFVDSLHSVRTKLHNINDIPHRPTKLYGVSSVANVYALDSQEQLHGRPVFN
jgi:hypothetical protein